MKTLFSILALTISTSAFAGTEVGNGGDVVTCMPTSGLLVKRAELLDYYEARSMYGLPNRLNPALSLEENLQTLLNNLGKTEPERAQKYAKWSETFFQESSMLDDVELTDIDDSKHLAFPRGCKVEQIIIQKEVRYSLDKRYVISKSLWDLLDNANRAGLIFHELLYRDAIANGGLKTGSRALRLVNALVAADRFTSVTEQERRQIWEEFGFKDINIRGIQVSSNGITYKTTDSGELYLAAFYPTRQQTMPYFGGIIDVDGVVRFLPNGQVSSVQCVNPVPGQALYDTAPCKITWQGKTLNFAMVQFYENGQISTIFTSNEIKVPSKQGTDFICNYDYENKYVGGISFFADGTLSRCSAKRQSYRFISDRYDLQFEPASLEYKRIWIEFDDKGYLKNFNEANLSGKYEIFGALREVTDLNFNTEEYLPRSLSATLKNNEILPVGKKQVAFRAGNIKINNGLLEQGTLADVTVLPVGKTELPIAPYVLCNIWGRKSKPMPTKFGTYGYTEGMVVLGAAADNIVIQLQYNGVQEIPAGHLFLNAGHWASDRGKHDDDLGRGIDYCK